MCVFVCIKEDLVTSFKLALEMRSFECCNCVVWKSPSLEDLHVRVCMGWCVLDLVRVRFQLCSLEILVIVLHFLLQMFLMFQMILASILSAMLLLDELRLRLTESLLLSKMSSWGFSGCDSVGLTTCWGHWGVSLRKAGSTSKPMDCNR